jgi:hypothetical protein
MTPQRTVDSFVGKGWRNGALALSLHRPGIDSKVLIGIYKLSYEFLRRHGWFDEGKRREKLHRLHETFE